MAVMSEVAEVFSRLFDHRPFLKGEIAFFKSEFEEKRGDREVEQLFRALELTTEIKQAQLEKVVEASDANLPRTIADIEVALRMCHTSLDSDGRTSLLNSVIERQRAERQRRLAVAKADVDAKLASINAAYDLKEKELEEKFSVLDAEKVGDIQKTNVQYFAMVFIRVIPSASFVAVLEELHTCPGAPKSIKQFFYQNKNKLAKSSMQICTSSKKSISPDSEERQTEKSVIVKRRSQSKEQNSKSAEADDSRENSGEERSCESLLLLTSDVKWCHAKLRERGMPQRIHQLLNDSEILLPKYEAPPRNPELEARIQKLRADQENKEYQRMTESISQLRNGFATTIGNEYRQLHVEMMKHLITGIQYILSVVGTFYALFMGVSLVNPDYGVRVLFGIIGALIVALAEIYFIIRDDIRVESKTKNK